MQEDDILNLHVNFTSVAAAFRPSISAYHLAGGHIEHAVRGGMFLPCLRSLYVQ